MTELLFNLPDDENVKYINSNLKLIEEDSYVSVVHENKLINKYKPKDTEYQKFVIIQLARIGAANFEQLCRGFDICDKTLEKYLERSKEQLDNLYNQKTGPRHPWKVDFGVRFVIIKIYINDTSLSYREIARRTEKELNITIDHKTVTDVLKKAGLKPDEETSSQNKNQPPKNDNATLDLFTDECFDTDITVDDEENQQMKENLQEGIETIYAGNLIFPSIEDNQKLYDAFEQVYGEIETNTNFSNKMFLDSLVHHNLLDDYTKDAFDQREKEDFGVLLHHQRGPNTQEISEFLAEVAKENKAQLFAETLSSLTIKPAYPFENSPEPSPGYRIIYIDGHFDPYYYRYPTFKGFHTVRRLAMKGDVSYSICDDQGRPIVCTRETANPKLNKIILDLIHKFRRISLNNNEILIVVFDREGYDKQLFWELSQLENTYWVSWEKSDKTMATIPDEKFTYTLYERLTGTNCLFVNYFSTTKQMVLKDESHSQERVLDLRKFYIQDCESKKRSSILSSVPAELFEDDWLISFLLVRQRQENFHKELKIKKGWDHYTTHLTEAKRKNAVVTGVNVPNPEIKSIKKQRGKITRQLNNHLKKFAKLSLADKIDENMTKKDMHEKFHDILSEIEKLKNQNQSLLEKEKSLPTHVPVEQAYPGKPIYQRDFEEKSFLEAIKIFAFNKENDASWQAAKFCRPKDRFLFLNMLKKRIGKIYVDGNTMFVKIKRFSSDKFQRTAEKLFNKVNGSKIKFPTDDKYNIVFDLY